MKNRELIKKLTEFDPEMEVCIVDWRKNLSNANLDGTSYGIEPNFNVIKLDDDVSMPFISLQFENDDYHIDGTHLTSGTDEGGKL